MSEQSKAGLFKAALEEAEALASPERCEGEGLVLHRYADYWSYRAAQNAGNAAKLDRQFVKRPHIAYLAEFLDAQLSPVRFGLCHGTRQGKEQRWFSRLLAGRPRVIGTEIGDSASDFPNTAQWDFHDPNPDWEGRADFVYSNSWDHAFDPARAFASWAESLRPGGLMLLDHKRGHDSGAANSLDPFGARFDVLGPFVTRAAPDLTELDTLDRRDFKPYRARVLVFRKAG